jgi:DNA-binding HxlR family transcriptional regulator
MKKKHAESRALKHETRQDACPVGEALNLVGKSSTLQILHRLYVNSPLRFTELQESLEVSPKVLTSRLKELSELGIVTRKSYDKIPPRVEYGLAAKGRDLLLCIPIDLKAATVTIPAQPGRMFDALQEWAEKYNFTGLKGKKS